jgi:hypothetical protein
MHARVLQPVRVAVLVALVLLVAAPVSASRKRIQTHRENVTDGAATNIFTIAIADGERTSGGVEWGLVLSDGTDHQQAFGTVSWSGVRKGAVCTPDLVWTLDATDLSAGTLTVNNWTATYAAGTITIAIDLTTGSSLVPTTAYVDVEIRQREPQDITLQ